MTITALNVGLGSLIARAIIACGGYSELPVRERLFAPAMFESFAREVPASRDGATRMQVRLDQPPNVAPDLFPKPWVVVGHPTIQSFGGRVLAWARGGCGEGSNTAQPAPDGPFRVCAAVRWTDSDTLPDAAFLTIVVESRATGQRVTFIADALGADGDPP